MEYYVQFRPCQRVSLFSDDGQVVLARPFFYTLAIGDPIRVELLTDDGTALKPVNEKAGLYLLGVDGLRLHLNDR